MTTLDNIEGDYSWEPNPSLCTDKVMRSRDGQELSQTGGGWQDQATCEQGNWWDFTQVPYQSDLFTNVLVWTLVLCYLDVDFGGTEWRVWENSELFLQHQRSLKLFQNKPREFGQVSVPHLKLPPFRKQSRCPSSDEWIKKLWYIYTMDYYLAIKRNAFESVLMRWMNLEPIIQGEVSQKEKTNIIY